MQAGGVVGGGRVFSGGFLQVGGVELLQRPVDVTGAVDIELVIAEDDTGEALAELGVHVLLEAAPGQLRPGGHVFEVL